MPKNPQPGYTEYEIVEADKLLTKFEGDRKKAAAAMGMPVRRLQNMIMLTALKGRHGVPDCGGAAKNPIKNIPQGQAAEITRKSRTKPVGDGGILQCKTIDDVDVKDLAVVEAINQEDRQLSKQNGFLSMASNDFERRVMAEAERLAGENIRTLKAFTSGGMATAFKITFIELHRIKEKIEQIIENPSEHTDYNEDGTIRLSPHDKLMDYFRLIPVYNDQLRKGDKNVDEGVKLRMEIEKLRKESMSDGIRAQPGFKPQVAKMEQHNHYYGEEKPKGKKTMSKIKGKK
jgi:hypothetical protein